LPNQFKLPRKFIYDLRFMIDDFFA
jgi:hypothetical protein